MSAQERLNNMTQAQALGLGAIAAVLYYFIMFDGGSRQKIAVQGQRSQLEQLRQDLLAEEERLREGLAYQQTVEELGRQYEALTEALPESLTAAELMRFISNEATAAGLSISRISEGTRVEAAETHEAIPITVDLRGSFAQILTFLANLTHLNLVTSVGDVSLAGSSLTPGEPVQVSLRAVIMGYRILPRPKRETVAEHREGW